MKKYFLFFSYMGFAQSDSLVITPPRRYPPSCDCFQGMINLTPRLAYAYAYAKSSYFAGLWVSLSTEAITPRVGLSLFNLLRADAGYAVPWAKAPLFKRFTLSIITDIRLLSYPLPL